MTRASNWLAMTQTTEMRREAQSLDENDWFDTNAPAPRRSDRPEFPVFLSTHFV